MAKLFIVGTPIGNLKDITFRAVETLSNVDFIACEDTRHTLKLLNHLNIKKPLFSCHRHNENEAAQKILTLIGEGKNIALVTDAGMPSVSDPGATVVNLCRENGIEIECVAGPSALTCAVALSGIKADGFAYLGFMPPKYSDKVRFLSKYKNIDLPLVFYIAPHDIKNDSKILLEVLSDRRVWLVKEITKIHEGVTVCNLSDLSDYEPKGEYVLIVDGAKENEDFLEMNVEEHLVFLINGGMDKKDAVKEVAAKRHLTKNEVYQAAIKLND